MAQGCGQGKMLEGALPMVFQCLSEQKTGDGEKQVDSGVPLKEMDRMGEEEGSP